MSIRTRTVILSTDKKASDRSLPQPLRKEGSANKRWVGERDYLYYDSFPLLLNINPLYDYNEECFKENNKKLQ